MSPKEKAEELVVKFLKFTSKHERLETAGLGAITLAKQCALITVDEIIRTTPMITKATGFSDDKGVIHKLVNNTLYWQEVKEEIEKL